MTILAPLLVLAAVTAAAQPLPAGVEQQVAAALGAEVRSRLGVEASVTVEWVHLSLREGVSGTLAILPAPQAQLGVPLAFVVIGTGAKGRPVQVGRGTAQVTVRVAHAQAARLLTRGTVLAASDLVEVVGDPGQVPLRRLPTVRDLVGGTLRRDMAAGGVVTHQTATLRPAVRVGETVQAVASVGAVQVTAELTVMDNGAEGAIVRVVNRDSHRELRARVVRAGVVEVMHD